MFSSNAIFHSIRNILTTTAVDGKINLIASLEQVAMREKGVGKSNMPIIRGRTRDLNDPLESSRWEYVPDIPALICKRIVMPSLGTLQFLFFFA